MSERGASRQPRHSALYLISASGNLFAKNRALDGIPSIKIFWFHGMTGRTLFLGVFILPLSHLLRSLEYYLVTALKRQFNSCLFREYNGPSSQ